LSGVTNFIHYAFGAASAGDGIKVVIDRPANVFLVDDDGYAAFKGGAKFNYWGGQAKGGPMVLKIPRSGSWHLVIDLGGQGGTIRHSAALVPARA
jgi:hypothetical protein